jgi:putative flippase GtrA
MRRVHYKVRAAILGVVDFFYPVFKKFMPLQTYRYAACGGSNTLLGLFIYFFSYHFILHEQTVYLGITAFKPHIAALFISLLVTFPLGFYLSMFVVFHGSYLKKRIQLFRYFLVIVGCLIINYFCLKLFVEKFKWFATPSQMLTTCIVVLFSYFSQRHFSFRVNKKGELLPAD